MRPAILAFVFVFLAAPATAEDALLDPGAAEHNEEACARHWPNRGENWADCVGERHTTSRLLAALEKLAATMDANDPIGIAITSCLTNSAAPAVERLDCISTAHLKLLVFLGWSRTCEGGECSIRENDAIRGCFNVNPDDPMATVDCALLDTLIGDGYLDRMRD